LVDEGGRAFRLSVYGLAIDRGSVLLVRVAPGQLDSGSWTLPGGGLDWGEHPLRGLSREFEEETGLVPLIGEPLFHHSFVHDYGPDSGRAPIHVVQAVYRVEASGEPVDEVDGSTIEARWWPLAEAGRLALVELASLAMDFAQP
jgi:ADP-ribose pyrophosphatase YjhB (NUDIX family)